MSIISCKEKEQPRKPISYSSGEYIKKSIQRNKEFVSEEEQLILDYIKKDSTLQYKESTAGFWFSYIQKNEKDTIKIQSGDVVQLDYKIENFENQLIYDFQQTQPKEYVVDKQEVVSGLRNAVKGMRTNEEIKCLLPSTMAYGSVGDKNKIGANTPIIMTIKVKSIKKNNE